MYLCGLSVGPIWGRQRKLRYSKTDNNGGLPRRLRQMKMDGRRCFYALLLSAVYLFYFGSCNFFVHSHTLPNGVVVHSHPFPEKEHSGSQEIVMIDLLSDVICEPAAGVAAPDVVETELSGEGTVVVCERVATRSAEVVALRGPPVA